MFQSVCSKNKLPDDLMKYLNNHWNAFLLLAVMERNQMDNEQVRKLVKYAEELSNAKDG